MCILDIIVWPSDSLCLESSIKAAATICHQSAQNLLLVYLPAHYSGVSGEALLKNTRLLEDKLMQNGLDIHRLISIHYYVHEQHGSDKRVLNHLLRACHSKTLGRCDWSKARMPFKSPCPSRVARFRLPACEAHKPPNPRPFIETHASMLRLETML